MAKHNPFRIFRKNQKAWLAGLTLFTMFSFIALGSMFQCLQVSSRPGQGVVFAKTKRLGTFDYNTMLAQQDEVNRLQVFLQSTVNAMAADGLLASQGNLIFAFEGSEDKPEERIPVILDQLMVLSGELSTTLSDGAEALVNRWFIVQAGRKEGLNPTEANIGEYLRALFNGKINSSHLTRGLGDAGLRQDGLVVLLKNQMIYDWMLRKADGGWRSDPITALTAMPTGHGMIPSVPGDQLKVGQRLYRTMKADTAVFPVENYFDQIPDPTEAQAHAFFEQYKNSPWSPVSERPGFYLPTKASYEGVAAELTDELLDAVTDEEIKDYYESHIEDFARPAPPSVPTPVPGIEGAEEFELPDDLESQLVPAPEEPAAEPATEQPAADDVSSVVESSPFRLVAYEEEAGETAVEAPEAVAEAAADEILTKEHVAEEIAEEDVVDAAFEEPSAEPVEMVSEDSAYYPLEEVREGIRQQIAVDKLVEELGEIQTLMEDFARRLANKRANVSTDDSELIEINLQELAEKKGFVYYQTSIADEEGNPVPALLDFNEAVSSRTLPNQILHEIYSSSVMDYSPTITTLIDDKIHLYWVTESKSEHTPEYSEVEGLVVATWKKQQAIGLAERDAIALKERILSDGKTLAQTAEEDGDVAKYHFVRTEPFTQYDLPRSFRSPSLTLGEVREEGVTEGNSYIDNQFLVAVGDGFFDTVYALENGGVGVCLNAPKDRAITLQVTERDDDASVFEKMAGPDGEGVDPGAVQTIRLVQNLKFQEDWLKQLKKDAGFEWVCYPGRIR